MRRHKQKERTPLAGSTGAPGVNWKEELFHKVISELQEKPPLPPGWLEHPEPQGRPSSFALHGTDERYRTHLDPRFLPASWKMGFSPRGNVIFTHENGAQTQVDPRGLPPAWRMQMNGSSGELTE